MKPWVKFAALVVAIVGSLAWLAVGGIQENKTYYRTIEEVAGLGNKGLDQRMRVGGDVEQGSIVRSGSEVRFVLTQEKHRLNVVYAGTDPLPDTFRDGSQALADGKLLPNGTFQANKIQAKCASKYEAKPKFKVVPTAQPANRAAL